jgi:hypothetical protein
MARGFLLPLPINIDKVVSGLVIVGYKFFSGKNSKKRLIGDG